MKKLSLKLFTVFLSALVLLGSSLFGAGALSFPNNVKTQSKSILLVSMDTGQTVYEKNADEKMYPASTTKIMTFIVAYEHIDDIQNTRITIKKSIIDKLRNTGSSMAYLSDHIGKKVSVTDILYSLMVPSGNDAAMVLADYVGNGDIDAFVEMMNDKAEELGCENTHFADPDGFHNKNHYTTARDLVKITNYALTLDGFEKIANTSRYTCEGDDIPLVTTNGLIDPNSEYYYQYAKGIKTGTTDEAGRCLVTTASADGQTYMLVLLGAPYKEGVQEEYFTFSDAKALFRWCLVELEQQPLKTRNTPMCELDLSYAWGKNKITLNPARDLNVILPANYSEDNIEIEYDVPKELEAPLKTSDVVGTASVYYVDTKTGDRQLLETIDLTPSENVDRSGIVALWTFIVRIFKSYWFLIIIALIILTVIGYMIAAKIHRYRKKKNREVKRYRNF